jgi:hypothetical protein
MQEDLAIIVSLSQVTSFIATIDGLQSWLRQNRRAGPSTAGTKATGCTSTAGKETRGTGAQD